MKNEDTNERRVSRAFPVFGQTVRISVVRVPITITAKQLEAEEWSSGRQCPSICPTRSGAVFCARRENHDGDHRGSRAQWREEKVPA